MRRGGRRVVCRPDLDERPAAFRPPTREQPAPPEPTQQKRTRGRHKIDPLQVQYAYHLYRTKYLPDAKKRKVRPARDTALQKTAAAVGKILGWGISASTLREHFKGMGKGGARKNTPQTRK